MSDETARVRPVNNRFHALKRELRLILFVVVGFTLYHGAHYLIFGELTDLLFTAIPAVAIYVAISLLDRHYRRKALKREREHNSEEESRNVGEHKKTGTT